MKKTRLQSFEIMRHDVNIKSLKREREQEEKDCTWSSKISRPKLMTDMQDDHAEVMFCQTKPFRPVWSRYPELERMTTVLENELTDQKEYRRRLRVMETEPQCAQTPQQRRAIVSVMRSRPSSDESRGVWHNPGLRTEVELFRQKMDALQHMCTVLEKKLVRLTLEPSQSPHKALRISMGFDYDHG